MITYEASTVGIHIKILRLPTDGFAFLVNVIIVFIVFTVFVTLITSKYYCDKCCFYCTDKLAPLEVKEYEYVQWVSVNMSETIAAKGLNIEGTLFSNETPILLHMNIYIVG